MRRHCDQRRKMRARRSGPLQSVPLADLFALCGRAGLRFYLFRKYSRRRQERRLCARHPRTGTAKYNERTLRADYQ